MFDQFLKLWHEWGVFSNAGPVTAMVALERAHTLMPLKGVRNFELDLVSWRNEKTQAIPNGCVG